MTTPSRLPDYAKPPVIEVVCGVQFESIGAFASVHYGLFWQKVKDLYPSTQDQVPLSEIFETQGGTEVKPFVVSGVEPPPLRRVFYVDESGNYLVQVQPSRLLANWRKVHEEDEYPRFDVARSRFEQAWKLFQEFVEASNLGPIRVTQYEVTYINHIVGEGISFPRDLPEYLALFAWPAGVEEPKNASMKLRLPMAGNEGILHLTVNHGKRVKDQWDTAVLELTARGPAKADQSEMGAWFEQAHVAIVATFDRVTTENAHRAWEKR